MSDHINIVRIKAVNNALQELRSHAVFVGGATISLYSDRPVLEVRPTDDVDVIIEILNYKQRQQLEERLREIGFTNDVESGILCRFKIKGIIVDIMPTNDPSIGFHNIWYPKGYAHAQTYALDSGESIKILTAPYFIATNVLENRTKLWEELDMCDKEVKAYLINEFSELLKNPFVYEWIDSHVERVNIIPQTSVIIENIRYWLLKNVKR